MLKCRSISCTSSFNILQTIIQEKLDQCLELLKNASVEDEEEDDEGLTELEGKIHM